MVASFMLILDTSQYLSCNRTVNYAICYSGNPIHQLMILCDHAFVAHRQSDFQWDGISKTDLFPRSLIMRSSRLAYSIIGSIAA